MKILSFVVLAFACTATNVNAQVDTGGDGLLDLVDHPSFDPNPSGTLYFSSEGVEDLDGANHLTRALNLNLSDNQISSVEAGDFDDLFVDILNLHNNQIVNIEIVLA